MGSINNGLIKESLTKIKRNYLNKEIATGVVVIALLFCAFLLYCGAAFNPASEFKNVKMGVLNLDEGFVLGTTTIRASAAFDYIIKNVSPLNSYFDWEHYNSSTITLEEFKREIEEGNLWGGLVISPSYSSTIFNSAENITAVEILQQRSTEYYNPTHYAMYYYYDEGRNYNMHSVLNKSINGIVTKLALAIPGAFVQNLPAPLNSMVDPYFLSFPLNLNVVNLHPVNFYGVNFMTYIFATICWIAAMSMGTVLGLIQPPKDEVQDMSSQVALYGFRLIYAIVFNLLFSLFIIFGYFAYDQTHNAGLLYLWTLLWLTCAECIILLLVTLFTVNKYSLFASLFLILQLSTGSAFIAEELSASLFFYIGRGLPFYYAVRGARFIIFGSLKNQMGANVGVLFAWGIGTLLLSVLVILLKMRAYRKQVMEAHIKREDGVDSISDFVEV